MRCGPSMDTVIRKTKLGDLVGFPFSIHVENGGSDAIDMYEVDIVRQDGHAICGVAKCGVIIGPIQHPVFGCRMLEPSECEIMDRGNYCFQVDTSVDTGFWVEGMQYYIQLKMHTVAGNDLTVIFTFEIEDE